MRRILYFVLLSLMAFASCAKKIVPTDADDNFILSLVLKVGTARYPASITENSIEVMVPESASLKGAEVDFKCTGSASIFPEPKSITDWDSEFVFRVTSYNGVVREYTYRVVRRSEVPEGTVVLKTEQEITEFAKMKPSLVNGNLVIGTDDLGAPKITDIKALSTLKEVKGVIDIRSSFAGGDLQGLENIVQAGGLQLVLNPGTERAVPLALFSMPSLRSVSGQIVISDNTVRHVVFERLQNVELGISLSLPMAESIEFPLLTAVNRDFKIQAIGKDVKPPITVLELPKLEEVSGTLLISGLSLLETLKLNALKKAYSLQLVDLSKELSTLELKSLEVVDYNLQIEGTAKIEWGNVQPLNGTLTKIEGLEKLKKVGGELSVCYFNALSSFPLLQASPSVGGIRVEQLLKVTEFDFSNVNFTPAQNGTASLKVRVKKLQQLKTKEDLSDVDVEIKYSDGDCVTNFTSVGSLTFYDDFSKPAAWAALLTLKKVRRNFDFQASNQFPHTGFPVLEEVGGFFCFKSDCNESRNSIDFPVLKSVGGQMQIDVPSSSVKVKQIRFDALTSVCTAENPKYKNKFIYGKVPLGSLSIEGNVSIVVLPKLERVGGDGLKVKCDGLQLPSLLEVTGFFIAEYGEMTSADLQIPKLQKVSRVQFKYLSRFKDFSMFAGLFTGDHPVITKKDQWIVEDCGYNPTFEDMKAGRYKQ